MGEITLAKGKQIMRFKLPWKGGTMPTEQPSRPSNHKRQQIKLSGQMRQDELGDNLHLQRKHTAVPGLSRALPRKSAQSTRKKYLITDHAR